MDSEMAGIENSKFVYTYVLRCADGLIYTGSTSDLNKRMREHESGTCQTTACRRPVKLIYFEACLDANAARQRELQLKTGYGRAYLKRRLAAEFVDAENGLRGS